MPKNNPIHPFESSEDIVHYLKDQWAGLFQRFLKEQRRIKETNLLQGLENTAATLNQLINYLTEEKKDSVSAIRDILLSNHPIFERIKSLLRITYRIFFLTRNELTLWLKVRNYVAVEASKWEKQDVEEWTNKTSSHRNLLKINSVVFDEDGNLIPIQKRDWDDDLVSMESMKIPAVTVANEAVDDSF